jgi:hypothetical protein
VLRLPDRPFVVLRPELLERDELLPDRDELDFDRLDDEPPERDRLDEPLERVELVLAERRELVPPLDDEPVLRLPERPLVVARREPLDRRRDELRRSAAGISSCATALVSCGISLARKSRVRSSSRRIFLAICAVSRSFTVSASVSIIV